MRTAIDDPPLASRRNRQAIGLAWIVLTLVSAAPRLGKAAGQDAENLERLRSIPLEERQVLWEKLKEFDTLSRSERAAIRSLDARISQLPPAVQANYKSVLRRYHQWVQGLTEAQRNELNAAPPGERMGLVTKFHAAERSESDGNATPLFLQVIDFGGAPTPFEMAHRLRTWFDLSPEQRAEIEKIPSLADRQKRLVELGQRVKGGPANPITRADEDEMMAKIESNPQLKNWPINAPKKADSAKQEKARRRMVINYYFLEHPPTTVDPSNLMRFEAEFPSWYREPFDHLPAEEARRRLTILYRLIFPAPGEMPEIRKAEQRRGPAPPRPVSPSAPSESGSDANGPEAERAHGCQPVLALEILIDSRLTPRRGGEGSTT